MKNEILQQNLSGCNVYFAPFQHEGRHPKHNLIKRSEVLRITQYFTSVCFKRADYYTVRAFSISSFTTQDLVFDKGRDS